MRGTFICARNARIVSAVPFVQSRFLSLFALKPVYRLNRNCFVILAVRSAQVRSTVRSIIFALQLGPAATDLTLPYLTSALHTYYITLLRGRYCTSLHLSYIVLAACCLLSLSLLLPLLPILPYITAAVPALWPLPERFPQPKTENQPGNLRKARETLALLDEDRIYFKATDLLR